jgi:hypothetical protein
LAEAKTATVAGGGAAQLPLTPKKSSSSNADKGVIRRFIDDRRLLLSGHSPIKPMR